MTSVVDGTRFARAAATRQAIVTAAAELFGRQGYRFVSLREIAVRAGISHPALLKHFADKDELLAEVAKRYARTPAAEGRDPFFAALVGEASAPLHPLHAWMRDRLAASVADGARELTQEGLGEGRDAESEAISLVAARSGLRMLQRYLPARVDVTAALDTHERLIQHPAGWRAPEDHRPGPAAPPAPPLPPLIEDEPEQPIGYRTGRARRSAIVEDAMTLFAREGYGDTSLQDIATRVGVSKSALYHHFPSKDALLLAVLRERDHRIDDAVAHSPTRTAAEVLRGFADGAEANERDQPGLIELYAVISSEATVADHPAHAHFEHRFTRALDGFTALFQAARDAGDMPAHRDPAHEALWVLALWDGLQYLWLYDHDSVDVADALRTHLGDVLPH
jgi:AcrR family transcriptional regulator